MGKKEKENIICPQCSSDKLTRLKKGFFSGSYKFKCSSCNYQGPPLLRESFKIALGATSVLAVFVIISMLLGEEGSIGVLGIIAVSRYIEDSKYRKIVNSYRREKGLPPYKSDEENSLLLGIIYIVLILFAVYGLSYIYYE